MPPFPKLISYNSKADVIKNPVVIPVFFPSTPDQANTVKFLQKATSDANWTALARYGVGAATVGQAVNVSQNPPAKISTAEISQFVQNNAATWTTLHGSEIFMLYYPTSTQITDNPGSGYHSSTTQTSPVVFGVIPYSSLMEDAYLQYHELVEAATDPLGGGIYLLDRDDISYSSFGMGTEIGDMCVLSDFYYSAEFGTSMKSVWSNQRIASGQSPCAASSGSLDMFGAVPNMPTSFKETSPIPNPAALKYEWSDSNPTWGE
ncbi:hypothetical protein [Sapientia aquatica]|nr:hypothetical protein [Sapientia aquatica]